MDSTPPPSEWARPEGLGPLAEQYAAALATGDLRRSRSILADAATEGVPYGSLYEMVARPGMHAHVASARRSTGSAGSTAERLVVASVQAAFGELVARRPELPAPLRHRRAVVSIGGRPLERLDGEVICEVLEMDGWSVTEVSPEADPHDVLRIAVDDHVELVVLPTTSAADLLLAAPTYTLLRRLPDPPLLVACGLGAPDRGKRARAVGADAYAGDLDALLEVVARMLPDGPSRRWGVRLARRLDVLEVAPTGTLDREGAARLRDVVESRSGSFSHLVLDLSDVAEATVGGMRDVAEWSAALSPSLSSLQQVGDPQLRPGP